MHAAKLPSSLPLRHEYAEKNEREALMTYPFLENVLCLADIMPIDFGNLLTATAQRLCGDFVNLFDLQRL